MSNWLSVKTRLPEEGQEVLVYTPNHGGKRFVTDRVDPSWQTHWCELLPAPSEHPEGGKVE